MRIAEFCGSIKFLQLVQKIALIEILQISDLIYFDNIFSAESNLRTFAAKTKNNEICSIKYFTFNTLRFCTLSVLNNTVKML